MYASRYQSCMCTCSISCHVGQPSCSHLTTPFHTSFPPWLLLPFSSLRISSLFPSHISFLSLPPLCSLSSYLTKPHSPYVTLYSPPFSQDHPSTLLPPTVTPPHLLPLLVFFTRVVSSPKTKRYQL